MTTRKSLRRRIAVAVGGQFVHGLYQLVVVTAAPPGARGALVGAGLLAAVTGGAYSVRTLTRRTASMESELARVRAERDDARGEAANLRVELETVESDLRAAREAAPVSPSPAALSTDGGLAAADGTSMAEIDDYLAEAAQVVDAAGEGDLTRRMSVEVPSETLAQLSEEFNEMADAFEQTIETAAGFSEEVAGSSEQVTTATEAVKDASERVAGNIQEIADVFHEQHEQISQISDEMSEMSATIEEIAASSNEVSEMADKTERHTVEGIEAGREAH